MSNLRRSRRRALRSTQERFGRQSASRTRPNVILHDAKRRTVSLLTQIGVKEKIPFVSSAVPVNPNNLLAEMPLVMVRLTDHGADYLPLCSVGGGPIPPRQMSFDEWWNEPIFTDRQKATLSRRTLVQTLRDQEGGSHFDDEIKDAIYRAVAYDNAAGWLHGPPGGPGKPINPGPHFASMRQIAWEIEQSLSSGLT
jgi:hypothetical protein